MKIDQNVTFLKSPAEANAAAANREALALKTAGLAAAGTHSVAAPSAAAQLPSTNSDFNAARVAKIREDISAGRYLVKSEKIADGLIASVQELLSGKPQ